MNILFKGDKLVGELLHSSFKIHSILAFPEWIERNRTALTHVNTIETNTREMADISNFQSMPEVIALAEIPEHPLDETPAKSINHPERHSGPRKSGDNFKSCRLVRNSSCIL